MARGRLLTWLAIELLPAVYRDVLALGQVLAYQAVDVLAGAARPRAVRVTGVRHHAGVGRQFGMDD